MNRILEFFQEESGSLSATRLILICWAIPQSIVYFFLCISNLAFQPINDSYIVLLSALMTAKLVQKPFETGTSSTVEQVKTATTYGGPVQKTVVTEQSRTEVGRAAVNTDHPVQP